MPDMADKPRPIIEKLRELGIQEASDKEYAEREVETMTVFAPFRSLRLKKRAASERKVEGGP